MKTPKRILALDPATHCGWAHSSGVSGVWDLSIKKGEPTVIRLENLRWHLEEVLRDLGIDLLVFEGVFHAHGHPKALIVQSEIQGLINLWCYDHQIDTIPYPSTKIKKFAGKGNASKAWMIEKAVEYFGREFTKKQHDEVDALWLLEMVVKLENE